MYSLNQVQLIGNATKAPEMKRVGSSYVANFSIATNSSWKDKNTGERKGQTEYHNIVAWGRLAEVLGQYLQKGNKVYISGRLQTRSWDDDHGKKHYKTEIVADSAILLTPQPKKGEYESLQENKNQDVRRDDGSYERGPDYEGEKISVEDLPF